MKSALLTLTALGTLAMAAPAFAQNYGYQNGYYGSYNSTNQDRYYNSNQDRYYERQGWNDDRADANLSIDTRIVRLEQRLNAGIRSGTIDRDEAMRLRMELRDLRRTNRQYGYGGLSGSERADLIARLRSVRDDIAAAEGGAGYGYSSGYGYNNGSTYSGNGYSGSYSGSYGNGYGSYSYGSTNNGYYGQGGPYEDADGYATLRIGERATGSLYGVPTELRNTYRDGWNYYYRSDGRAVYQIDSRTNTVLRVYPLNR